MIVRAVLWLCAPESDAETIAGDLFEEFGALHRSRYWLIRQSLQSVIPLLIMRWRSGELSAVLLAAIIAVAIPPRIADLFWAFIHSQIPLKADTSWSASVWVCNLVVASAGVTIAARSLGRRAARIFSLLSIAAALFAFSIGVGCAPAWVLAALPILILAAALWAAEFNISEEDNYEVARSHSGWFGHFASRRNGRVVGSRPAAGRRNCSRQH